MHLGWRTKFLVSLWPSSGKHTSQEHSGCKPPNLNIGRLSKICLVDNHQNEEDEHHHVLLPNAWPGRSHPFKLQLWFDSGPPRPVGECAEGAWPS